MTYFWSNWVKLFLGTALLISAALLLMFLAMALATKIGFFKTLILGLAGISGFVAFLNRYEKV